MKRILGALVLALVLAAPARAELKVTDDRGVTVTLPQSPRRIVSLLPSLTETVCELGECGRLVGVDRYSNYPASVLALPRVGGGIDPNIEAVVALKPDVVLMATSSRGAERLESLGVKVLAMEPRTAADVPRVMEKLGQLLQVPDAQRIWRAINAGVAAAAQSLPPAARGARVYFEVSRGPYAAGPGSFIGDVLQRLGARNIITPEMGPFPRINPEFVVKADPDLILIGDRNADGLEQRPGWAKLRAVREKRICVFDAAQSDVLVRPGPRMAEAARLLAGCLAAKAGK
ncbi:ABC transporter substrate-binding protein [Ramlibacter sp. G-1-2-2]|uniref:ABC transporter substrate-binding protein n=1 Tax=Ramlibacter agri TaxID=2728837 RepID=A0A848H2W0_9BURK|nr:ABC transporter substrate-binding protein [Ramlibacter agri]